MDPTFNAEGLANARSAKSNAVLILIGIVLGILMSAGVAVYVFRQAVFFTAIPTVTTSALSFPNPSTQKPPDLKVNILLPKKLVSQEYYLLINKITNGLTQALANNNATLLPLMNAIKQKSSVGDYSHGFFDLVFQAKGEIKKNNDLLAAARTDIAAMKKVNGESVKDQDIYAQTNAFLVSGDTFVQAFADYLATLNETLSGSIPTQSLLDKLATQVTSLGTAGTAFQTELKTLLALIKEKDQASAP